MGASSGQRGHSIRIGVPDAIKKMVIASAAAIVSKTTTAPLDRVKLVLQVQNGIGTVRYAGVTDCLSQMTSNQGFLSLWRGNGASVMRCFPQHALNLVLRDVYRDIFLVNVPRSQKMRYFLGSVLAGGMGGASALVALYPLDFARTRLAVDAHADGAARYAGVRDCLRRTRRQAGILAWYRGFSPALQFVFASRAMFFGAFDTIRTGIVADQRQMPFLATLALAQSCLLVSGFACYPLDTVRRRMMVFERHAAAAAMPSVGVRRRLSPATAPPKTADVWRHIIRNEGWQALYKGAAANSMRSGGGALILALYYEFSKML